MSGCDKEEVRGRIAGTVIFQGKAVSEGLVLFRNIDKGVNMNATLKPDGSYEIITAKGLGLPLGVYRVSVCPPPLDPDTGRFIPASKMKPYPNIPQKYRSFETSGLTLEVKEGDNSFDINMKL
jgi:hypothetical protein